jgi:hypothetical protein
MKQKPNNNKKQTTKIPIKHQAANQKNNRCCLARLKVHFVNFHWAFYCCLAQLECSFQVQWLVCWLVFFTLKKFFFSLFIYKKVLEKIKKNFKI